MVLSLAVIFFVFNTFGETKINVTITSNPDLNDGLVGHWTFDGKDMTSNVADSSGNGNTGYLTGFTSTTTVIGKIGQALDFDGVDDYVQVANSISLNPANITISVWAKSNTATWNNPGMLVSKRNVYILHPISASKKLRFYIYDGGAWQSALYTSTSDITKWHNYIGTYDGSSIRIYEDGVEKSSTSYVGSITTSDTGVLAIGRDDGYSTRYLNGSLDDVRIYNRALSADEVTRLYQQGATTYLNKTLATNPDLNDGLVGHWTFDGVLNTQITDQSGNGNTGYFGASSNATNTLTTIGNIGQAVKMDGVGDNVYIGSGVLNQIEPNGFSIFMWLKSTETTNGRYFFERGGSGSFTVQAQSSGNAYCRIRNTSGTFLGTPSALVLDGEWHHVGCSFSTTTKAFTMYVDGASTTSKNAVAFDKFTDNANWFTIGGRKGGGFAEGTIDDFRVYNRSLSADEITRLYQQGATTYINKTIATNPDLNSGLVGHWTFDGADMTLNVADSSGNGNTGYLNGFTSTTTAIGAIGQALDFDGVDDYVNIGDSNSVDVTITTISAWIKTSQTSFPNGFAYIVKKDKFTGSGPYTLYTTSNNTFFALRSQDGGNPSVSAGVNPNDGNWHHIVATYDGNTLKIYYDGDFRNSANYTDTILVNATDVHIGGWENYRLFDGLIDDVRIYNRALSADEITRLYNLGHQ